MGASALGAWEDEAAARVSRLVRVITIAAGEYARAKMQQVCELRSTRQECELKARDKNVNVEAENERISVEARDKCVCVRVEVRDKWYSKRGTNIPIYTSVTLLVIEVCLATVRRLAEAPCQLHSPFTHELASV